ncbi:hypothetical protein P9139_12565 [Curtobacterium flaccumfaciens]|nr:hypothetical protein P9139_12565 [Curtobacterium flaccumfaciens]
MLVLEGEWDAARAFARGSASESAADRLEAWIDTVALLLPRNKAAASALARDGLVPALVNGAEALAPGWFAERLHAIQGIDMAQSGSTLSDAMIAALGSEDVVAIPRIAALRRVVPLMVDRVDASADGLAIGGPADLRGLDATIELTGPGIENAFVSAHDGARGWRCALVAESLAPGRYAAAVVFAGVVGRFPIVTARMPLPPLDEEFPMQPLADRKHGWRFLVDRRSPRRRGVGRVLMKLARKLR